MIGQLCVARSQVLNDLDAGDFAQAEIHAGDGRQLAV